MAPATVDRAGARDGFADALATVAGVLLLVIVAGCSIVVVIDVVARYGAGGPLLGPEALRFVETHVAIGFAAIAILALPAGLARLVQG